MDDKEIDTSDNWSEYPFKHKIGDAFGWGLAIGGMCGLFFAFAQQDHKYITVPLIVCVVITIAIGWHAQALDSHNRIGVNRLYNRIVRLGDGILRNLKIRANNDEDTRPDFVDNMIPDPLFNNLEQQFDNKPKLD